MTQSPHSLLSSMTVNEAWHALPKGKPAHKEGPPPCAHSPRCLSLGQVTICERDTRSVWTRRYPLKLADETRTASVHTVLSPCPPLLSPCPPVYIPQSLCPPLSLHPLTGHQSVSVPSVCPPGSGTPTIMVGSGRTNAEELTKPVVSCLFILH